ncbi:ZIP family metal transporter [Fictibacillus iocasae]|uniref:ZIP family metal transporter n=1 Tax=Fictibacillus iocasae TaxID=2715437 RepID=A0ABW2NL53_9BACL
MESVLLGSILSALATGAGALPVLVLKNATHKWRDILLAFAAGIMVAASTFSLIPQALDMSNLFVLTAGIAAGTLTLLLLERFVPHMDLDHSKTFHGIDAKAILIIAAITLHNLPEGLAVGVSYATEDSSLGGLIAFSIGLQNAPEGLLVALFLVNQNMNRVKAFLIATMTGAVEIITSLGGYMLTSYVENLVPYGLSFAAGAMLFIVYKELIPESHGDGHARSATLSFITGLLVMIYLTEIFG